MEKPVDFRPTLRKLSLLRSRPGLVHPRFGDLSRPGAVVMGRGTPGRPFPYTEHPGTFIHVTMTGRCYARCKGCINSVVSHGEDRPRNRLVTCGESDPDRDAAIISQLVSRLPEYPVTVCFYGGEPLLVPDRMDALRESLSRSPVSEHVRYMLYTSGELIIDALGRYPGLMEKIWLYSVSVDGEEDQHRKVRRGTSIPRIVENLRALKDIRKGSVLCWSTLREEQSLLSCFRQFLSLYREGLVDHFFWHWADAVSCFDDFRGFALKYGRELEQIMDVYVERLFAGELLPMAHINELLLFLLTGKERGHTACGVEVAKNFDVEDGLVHACTDFPAALSLGAMGPDGTLRLHERDLESLVSYKDCLGCRSCGVHAYCGGRCPVQALLGPPERTLQYCQLMRLHVGVVVERLDEISRGFARCALSFQEIYDRSAFICAFTDVVP